MIHLHVFAHRPSTPRISPSLPTSSSFKIKKSLDELERFQHPER
jgi:hypothetical protein